MARSKRTTRRSTSQRAVSVLASTLPSPIQKIANTSIGSTLILFGIPALLIAGVLHFNFDGGIPHLSIDRERAAEIRNAAHDELSKLNLAPIQQLHQSAHDLWNTAQGQAPTNDTTQTYPPQPGYPSAQSGYPAAPPAYQAPQQSYPQPQPYYQPLQQTYQPQPNAPWR